MATLDPPTALGLSDGFLREHDQRVAREYPWTEYQPERARRRSSERRGSSKKTGSGGVVTQQRARLSSADD